MSETLERLPVRDAGIDWDLMVKVASHDRGGNMICRYLHEPIRQHNFWQVPHTAQFYYAVATFLEEGWRSQRGYKQLRPEVAAVIDLDAFGRLVASVVRGYRYDQHRAQEAATTWIGEGSWPNRLDVAAFLFFKATVPH